MCTAVIIGWDSPTPLPPAFELIYEVAIHRLNMEVDLQSLFGLHVTWCAQLCLLAETPQLPCALVYESQLQCGGMRGGRSCGVSANEYSCAHHVTGSQNKLWSSTSIFNLCSEIMFQNINLFGSKVEILTVFSRCRNFVFSDKSFIYIST
jgi:hypothetical protein